MMEHDNVREFMRTCMRNWVTVLQNRKKICIGEITIKKEGLSLFSSHCYNTSEIMNYSMRHIESY